MLNRENKLMVWGSLFKEKAKDQKDGFSLYYGDELFKGGKIKDLSLKYSIFGALVEHK